MIRGSLQFTQHGVYKLGPGPPHCVLCKSLMWISGSVQFPNVWWPVWIATVVHVEIGLWLPPPSTIFMNSLGCWGNLHVHQHRVGPQAQLLYKSSRYGKAKEDCFYSTQTESSLCDRQELAQPGKMWFMSVHSLLPL